MNTMREMISEWFDDGVKQGAEFMIITTDTFDCVEYPVWVFANGNLREAVDSYQSRSMSKVMEIYSLKSSKDAQLNEDRAWHTEHFELKQREGDQPLPTVNDHADIQSRVIADIEARRQVGIQRYGTALQPFNGRDALQDLYEELIDAAMYIKQLIIERDTKENGQ